MTQTTINAYKRLRAEHPAARASLLLDWARETVKVDALKAEVEWDYGQTQRAYPLIDVGQFDRFSIRVYADDEPYDWGDLEPTERERESLEVIGVGVRIDGDDDDLDSIWSCGYDGYKQSSHDCALEMASYYGFIDAARAELAERARTAGYVETV
jgi:hypothetical protein